MFQNLNNVTLRRVYATIVAVKKKKVLHTLSVCVALGIHYAMRMRHIVNRGLPLSKIFFHILSQIARISIQIYIFSRTVSYGIL
jgi:hypothetical protein